MHVSTCRASKSQSTHASCGLHRLQFNPMQRRRRKQARPDRGLSSEPAACSNGLLREALHLTKTCHNIFGFSRCGSACAQVQDHLVGVSKLALDDVLCAWWDVDSTLLRKVAQGICNFLDGVRFRLDGKIFLGGLPHLLSLQSQLSLDASLHCLHVFSSSLSNSDWLWSRWRHSLTLSKLVC